MADQTRSSPNDKPWYADGLRFSCTSCGNCCTGPPGYVWFTPKEGQQIAKLLGLDEEQFLKQYARKIKQRYSLREHKTSRGFDCVFLDRESVSGKAVCSIYDARPTQCRTWPFWPENLRTKQAWQSSKKHTPCPGMDTGPLFTQQEIETCLDITRTNCSDS